MVATIQTLLFRLDIRPGGISLVPIAEGIHGEGRQFAMLAFVVSEQF
jgi:hypothetical protein